MKIPTDAKDVKALRDFFSQQRTAVCGLAECLEEPWRTHFNQLKNDYDEVLAGLPPTDAAPAAIEANKNLQAFASLLASANALCAMLGSHVDTMKKNHASAMNSAVDAAVKERISKGELIPATELQGRIDAAVKAEVEKRTVAGELVPKDTVTQLCSQAKDTGIAEGKSAKEAELKAKAERDALVATRRESLATAGLPLPENVEAMLSMPEAEFATAKAKAEERIAGLKKLGVAVNAKNPVWAKLWLADEAYGQFEALVKEIPGLKAGPEPLAGAGGGGDNNVVPLGLY